MTTTATVVNIAFSSMFAAAKSIEFNPEWANGTGYFNELAYVNALLPEVSAFIDNHGRRVLVVPTEMDGNVVIFERYTDNPNFLAFNAIQQRDGCRRTLTSGRFEFGQRDDELVARVMGLSIPVEA